MKKLFLCIFFLMAGVTAKSAGEQAMCKSVRLADIGWTDVTATTAVAAELLRILGYEPELSVVSVPVTFAGLKNNDLDVFLGNWMPTQEADIRPYLDEGSLIQLAENLSGAVYTLAVPAYVYEQGVKSFADLAANAARFQHEIYGIEPGNDGNRLILNMINNNAFGLKDFKLVESSEQAMLVQVKDAVARGDFVVFLAWAPHPMNRSIKIKYLAGGDTYFGPDFGASRVYTVTRRDFANDCPNLALLFRQLKFSVDAENQIMGLILDDGLRPEDAAKRYVSSNTEAALTWLDGIKTFHGERASLALAKARGTNKPPVVKFGEKAPIGQWMERAITLITTNGRSQFRAFSDGVEVSVEALEQALLWPHWSLVIAFFGLMAFLLHRSIRLTLFVLLGLLLIVNLGLWVETIKSLVLVMSASCCAMLLGFPLGVLAARLPWVYLVLRPMLDLMQTIPTFVYLIPSLMLFGLGLVPGLVSTIIFAIAAPIRLTYLGIAGVPRDLKEASIAFGATPWQTLVKVEIPCALPSLMAGLTQCVMLSLSMVVIASLVGADGLGTPVVRALNTVNLELGFEAGIAIVLLAIMLDRCLSLRNGHV